MEKIAWRAVKAICVLGVVLGGSTLALGWNAYERGSTQYVAASEEASSALEACRAGAKSDDDSDLCWENWRMELAVANLHADASKRGGQMVLWGLFGALVVPLVTLGTFFLFRWILTGRWRGEPGAIDATPSTENSV